MDQSWRFRSSPSPLCPSCLIPHLPFCSAPAPFNRPSFPDFHDPIPRFPPPPRSDPFSMHQSRSFRDEALERDAIYKRIRLDDGFADYAAQFRKFSEDERRLDLIRSHGQQQQQAIGENYPVDQMRLNFPKTEFFGSDAQLRGARYAPQLDKFLAEERNEFADRSFNGYEDGRFARLSRESQNVEMQRVDEAVRARSAYGYMEPDFGNSGDYESRRRREEGGMARDSLHQSHAHGNVDGYSGTIRDRLYWSHAHGDVDGYSGMVRDSLYKPRAHGVVDSYSEQRQFTSNGVALLPHEIPHFGRDSIFEPPLQNHAPSRVEYPYYESGILNMPPERSPPLQLKEVHGSFGIENHLPLERFSPPIWNTTNVNLPLHSGDNTAGPACDKAALPEKYPSLPPPQFAPSPPEERPAPHHHISLFPLGPSLAIPHQADPPKSFAAHPPPPPLPPSPPPPPITTTESTPNSQLYAPAFPNNIATSHLPMVNAGTLPSYVLQTPANQHHHDDRPISTKQPGTMMPVTIDASHIFRKPHRANRPDHIVVILRGLPGSGKSYMAKLLRDLEVEEGGSVPRVHSMDDYFMTEVEKIDDADGQKSSSSVRSRKPVTKTVMEYCYEPEMEEAYRASMLKAFKKTLDEGAFTFVIVDDRNLRVADFAQFWAIGKRSGYEVYLLEAPYKDPMGCAARNVHGFTSDDIQKMAEKWEEAPSLYMQIDAQSLFHVDGLNGQEIKEVEMDMEEESPCDEKDAPKVQEVLDAGTQGHVIVGYDSQEFSRLSDVEEEEVKELGRSKWSNDLDSDIMRKHEGKEHLGALSGLVQAYSKPAKSVSWGDQGGRRGFAIGASNNLNNTSLIIGPGTGYNLRSNPVLDEETTADTTSKNANESRKHSIFLEHSRAEHESFRLVFDRRRHRIGISDADDE